MSVAAVVHTVLLSRRETAAGSALLSCRHEDVCCESVPVCECTESAVCVAREGDVNNNAATDTQTSNAQGATSTAEVVRASNRKDKHMPTYWSNASCWQLQCSCHCTILNLKGPDDRWTLIRVALCVFSASEAAFGRSC